MGRALGHSGNRWDRLRPVTFSQPNSLTNVPNQQGKAPFFASLPPSYLVTCCSFLAVHPPTCPGFMYFLLHRCTGSHGNSRATRAQKSQFCCSAQCRLLVCDSWLPLGISWQRQEAHLPCLLGQSILTRSREVALMLSLQTSQTLCCLSGSQAPPVALGLPAFLQLPVQ